MVNQGTQADDEGVKAKRNNLSGPYFPMLGNHDQRDLVRQGLPVTDPGMADFVQYKFETPDGLVLCLDTPKAGTDEGEFGQYRREWLQDILQSAGNTPVFLFIHHPPMPLVLPMQDSDNMKSGQAFIDLVSGFECVKHLLIGHVQRPIAGTVGRIPFATVRSVLYQVPLPQPEWG